MQFNIRLFRSKRINICADVVKKVFVEIELKVDIVTLSVINCLMIFQNSLAYWFVHMISIFTNLILPFFLQFLLYFAIKMAYHHYVQTNWKHIVVEEKLLNTNQRKLLIPVNLGLYYLHYSMMFIIWTVIFFSGHARGDNLKECSVIFAIQCISYKDKFILRLIFA